MQYVRAPRTIWLCCLLTATLLTSCAPVATRVDPAGKGKGNDGLVYHLPLKAVIVTLTVKNSGTPKRTITLDTTGAFADRAHRFVARYRSNQVGTNALTVNVDENGLLDGSTTSTVTPKVSDVLTGLATDFGYVTGQLTTGNPRADAVGTPCDADGTYSWVVTPAVTDLTASTPGRVAYDKAKAAMTACNITFDPRPLFSSPASAGTTKLTADHDYTGFFYRQSVPYILTVTDEVAPALTQSKLVSIPTHDSPLEFLPVQKSLFGANSLAITFSAGTPKTYTQSADSEWLGVVTIPAAILKAYLNAVTDAFKDKTANTGQQQYLAGLSTLLLQQQKTNLCLQAMKSGNQDQIKTACQ